MMVWFCGRQRDNDRSESGKYPRLRGPNECARLQEEQGEAQREGSHSQAKHRCAYQRGQGAVHTHAKASIGLGSIGSP